MRIAQTPDGRLLGGWAGQPGYAARYAFILLASVLKMADARQGRRLVPSALARDCTHSIADGRPPRRTDARW